MKKLRTALIGTGVISHTHIAAMRTTSLIEPVACWNRIEEKNLGIDFSNKYQLNYYTDIDEMIDHEKPDIVVNALTPRFHNLGLESAAKSGAHLIVEKPMSITVDMCKEILDISERYNVLLAISESSGFDRLKSTFSKHRDKFGKILHLFMTNYRHYFAPDRNQWIIDPVDGEGGMILNVGVHRVAAMRMIMNSPEVKVTAQVNNKYPEIPVPGDCSIQVQYENDRVGTLLMCGYHKHGDSNPNLNHVVTEKGHININKDHLAFTDSDGKTEVIPFDDTLSEIQYVNLYNDFANAVLSNKTSPYSGEEGMRDVAVIRAVILSSEEKRTVNLEEVLNT